MESTKQARNLSATFVLFLLYIYQNTQFCRSSVEVLSLVVKENFQRNASFLHDQHVWCLLMGYYPCYCILFFLNLMELSPLSYYNHPYCGESFMVIISATVYHSESTRKESFINVIKQANFSYFFILFISKSYNKCLDISHMQECTHIKWDNSTCFLSNHI